MTALRMSLILFFSLSGGPHGHVGGASSIKHPVKYVKGVAGSFFKQNHYVCHPLLDLNSWQGKYSAARYPQRWMPAHPISTGISPPLSFFLCRETAKKYLHNSKCGLIPRYPLHTR